MAAMGWGGLVVAMFIAAAVGFNLYTRLLAQAVKKVKEDKGLSISDEEIGITKEAELNCLLHFLLKLDFCHERPIIAFPFCAATLFD